MSLFSRMKYMNALFHCNRSTFTAHRSRRFSLFPGRTHIPKDQPFYEVKKPSILVKFTWTLLIADAVCTLAMCEFSWNYFTRPVEPTESAISDDPNTIGNTPQYVLRPTYQRAGLVFMHLAFGGWVAFMIGMKSGMNVKRIWLTPRPREDLTTTARKAIVRPKVATFESFGGFGLRGDVLNVKHCRLSTTKPADDLSLIVATPGNREQRLSIATKGVYIAGRPVSRDEVHTSLLQVFGHKSDSDPATWRSGPILGAQKS
ncbi:hypothetical protein DEU56DRAFT_773739 [Suillus clintonianus]|uniref:uncharacterized protein n=1 Tax=Suillus clintonianus TaxID=1904413 RepID=UPI001B868C1B|nr:uncharacterized protein DEU56DRAFT_773739 [Suillus clintonianus]KAG2153211.1 hypothetical protein DEU56DRAFT_773739 [Suillus clintonianus]